MAELTIKTSPVSRPRGVTIFAFLLIVSSLIHIHKLIVDRDMYVYFYSYWPTWLIMLRYSFSWFQRILGLAAGIGILSLKEIGRRIALFIGCFTILTIYWKHPYAGFKNLTLYIN